MQFTASQIAALAGGTIEGNGDAVISSFAKIEEGHPGAISFLANPKYTHHIYSTKSSAVLVSNDFQPEHPVECTLIRVADPYATVAALMDMASKMLRPNPTGIEEPAHISESAQLGENVYVGAFAYIGKNVKLGNNAKIYPHSYIGDNVVIGDDTIIYSGVNVYHNCHIGSRCIIHSGAVIGADGFGFAPVGGHYNKIPQLGNVEIADDVEIGANTTVDRATMGSTRVMQGSKLDNLIQVAHNCTVGENTVMAAQSGIAGSTKIGSHCMIGGQVGFAGHIEVGDNVQIGAQSGIPSNVAAGSRIMGSPAVDYSRYARQVVFEKNLPSLYARVKELESRLEKLTQQ